MSKRWLVAALAAFVAGCESDSTVASTSDPNEDQALALSVMGARGDTLTAAVENEVVVDTELPPDLRPPAPSSQSAPVPTPALAPALVQAAPTASGRQPARGVAITIPKPEPRMAAAITPTSVERRLREREEPKRESRSRTGLIARGSTLAIFTTGAVCNDDAVVGNTFRATLTSSVRGTNGAVIPAGAQVVAEITSIDKWGAGMGVRVKSVRVDGRSYPVSSRVGYVMPVSGSNGACIPRHTHLETEVKDPIRIASLN